MKINPCWFVVLIAFLLLSSYASASVNVFWLRGTKTLPEAPYYSMNSSPPNANSAKADLSVNTKIGENEWVRWYSSGFSQNLLISGKVYVWFSKMGISNDSGSWKWILYELDPLNNTEELLAESDWAAFPDNSENESSAQIPVPALIEARHKLKLVLKYNSVNGGGKANLSLDEGSEGTNTVWNTSEGLTFTAYNVKSAGIIQFNLCGESADCGTDIDCDDDNPLTGDKCLNVGSCDASCSNLECITKCKFDSDCDDGSALTNDKCIDAGVCDAYCSSESCELACNSNKDCSDSNPFTTDICLFVGTCMSECENKMCAPECSKNADCDDGDSGTADVCVGSESCNTVCWNSLSCGNGVCDEGETKCNCPGDCGSCEGKWSICGEMQCNGLSCENAVDAECCGNGLCELAESAESCALDCATAFSAEVVAPKDGEFFLLGSDFVLNLRLSDGNVSVLDADIAAKGFFGEVVLLDDGEHNDLAINDGVYGNKIYVSGDVSGGVKPIIINVSKGADEIYVLKEVVVASRLSLELRAVKDSYAVGEEINLGGFVKRGGVGIKTSVGIGITLGGQAIHEEMVYSNEDGFFEASYKSNFSDPSGNWIISADAKDTSGNSGHAEQKISFMAPSVLNIVEINFIGGPKEKYYRGESIALFLEIIDQSGEKIKGADVKILTASNDLVSFVEEGGGYRSTVPVEIDAELGNQRYVISALKIIGDELFGGEKSFEAEILESELLIDILEPKQRNFAIGDIIKFHVRLSYSGNRPVEEAFIETTIGNDLIEMQRHGSGVPGEFIAEYRVSSDNYFVYSITAHDLFGNSVEKDVEFTSSGISPIYLLQENLIIILSVSLIIVLFLIHQKRKASRKDMKTELMMKIKNLQTAYFKEGAINRGEYDKIMLKYEGELKDLEK
ncbi:MAG: hypothetical protein ABID38_04305 [Candidatus Diapherotrites archaeon]